MAKTTKQAADADDVEEAGQRRLYGTRSDSAVTSATHQLEAIFKMMIACVRQVRGDEPEWPNFDTDGLPDVIRALAIRGCDLNSAIMSARLTEITAEDLESLVYLGRSRRSTVKATSPASAGFFLLGGQPT